jgi:hypothetical protein
MVLAKRADNKRAAFDAERKVSSTLSLEPYLTTVRWDFHLVSFSLENGEYALAIYSLLEFDCRPTEEALEFLGHSIARVRFASLNKTKRRLSDVELSSQLSSCQSKDEPAKTKFAHNHLQMMKPA